MDIDDSIISLGLELTDTYFENNSIGIECMIADIEYELNDEYDDNNLLDIFVYLVVEKFPDQKKALFLECDQTYTLIDQFDVEATQFDEVLNHPLLSDIGTIDGSRHYLVSYTVSIYLFPDPPYE